MKKVNTIQEVINPPNNGSTVNVVQGLGSSIEDVMSQYAVTDKINRLQSMVDAVSGGFESSILFDSPAPTPAKNCFYEFINDGICTYLNNKQVYSGDRLYVTYTAPSTHVYNYGHDALSNRESVLNSIVNTVTKLVDIELVHPTWIPGSYVNTDGTLNANGDFKYFELPYSGIPIKLTCDVGMGGVVAIVSYFNEDIFLGFQYPGTNNLNNVSLIIPSGTTKIKFSAPNDKDLILKTEELSYYDISKALLDIENVKLEIDQVVEDVAIVNNSMKSIGDGLKGFSPYAITWIPGHYVNIEGTLNVHTNYKYFEISSDITKYKITTTSYVGGSVALIAFWNGSTFLGYSLAGSQVLFDYIIIPPEGTTKIIISTSDDKANYLYLKKYQNDAVSKEYVDSTGCGYAGVATLDGIPSNNIGDKFYIANLAGIYTNYGGVTIPNNGLYFIKYINATWSLEKLTDIFAGYSNSKLRGEKWMAVGDSLTSGGGYINEMKILLGLSDCINKGVSGRRLENMIYEDDGATLISSEEILSCKLITIISQANDWGSNRPLGTLNDAIIGNANTFYGDCKKVIDYYLGINPDIVLAIGSEFPQSNDGTNWLNVNGAGATVYDYAKIIKEVCGMYSVCHIDLYTKSGCNKYTQNDFYGNQITQVHPDPSGYSAMAKLIARETYNYITV